MIIQIHREGTEHAVHDEIRDADVFDDATTPTAGFDADAAVGANEDTI